MHYFVYKLKNILNIDQYELIQFWQDHFWEGGYGPGYGQFCIGKWKSTGTVNVIEKKSKGPPLQLHSFQKVQAVLRSWSFLYQ